MRGCVPRSPWVGPDVRGGGLGKEMRQAVPRLAFDKLEARKESSDAFFDNRPSNRVSHALGYGPNGVTWDTRRGEPAEIKAMEADARAVDQAAARRHRTRRRWRLSTGPRD